MQECGDCTVCCEILPVMEFDKPLFQKCEYADRGCAVYADRPESCHKYSCAWLQMKEVGLELRPDKCGTIFERYKQSIYAFIIGDVTEIVKRQITMFKREGFEVKVYTK